MKSLHFHPSLLQRRYTVYTTTSRDCDGQISKGQVFEKTWDQKAHALVSLRRHIMYLLNLGCYIEALDNDVYVMHTDEEVARHYFFVKEQKYTVSVNNQLILCETRQEAAKAFFSASVGLEVAGCEYDETISHYHHAYKQGPRRIHVIMKCDGRSLLPEVNKDWYFQSY